MIIPIPNILTLIVRRALSLCSWGVWSSAGLSNLPKVTGLVDLELRYEPRYQTRMMMNMLSEFLLGWPLLGYLPYPVQSPLLFRPAHYKQPLGLITFSGPSVRRASLSPLEPGKPQEEGHPIPAHWLSSDCSIAQVHYIVLREKVDMSTSGKPNTVNLINASSVYF